MEVAPVVDASNRFGDILPDQSVHMVVQRRDHGQNVCMLHCDVFCLLRKNANVLVVIFSEIRKKLDIL